MQTVVKQTRKKCLDRWRVFRLATFFLVVLYLGLSPPIASMFCEFLPDKAKASSYPQIENAEQVWFKASNGSRIHGFYFPSGDTEYGAIIHHGQSKNIGFIGYLETAQVLNKSGASVLLYDYEGFGASEGKPSNSALHRDAEAAYSFMINEKSIKPEKIIHCGVSLGTGAASYVASLKPCGGVILFSPYLSLTEVSKKYLPYLNLYPTWAFPKPELGSSCLIDKDVPVLIIHGEKDPIMPISGSEKLKKLRKAPTMLIRVPGPFHMGSFKGESSVDLCKDFYKLLEGISEDRS